MITQTVEQHHNLTHGFCAHGESQLKLNEALIRAESVAKEVEQLRSLVDAQQDELRVISEARQRVQGLYEDLQKRHVSMDVSAELLRAENTKLANENAHCRTELDRQRVEVQRLIRDRIPAGVDQDAALALAELRDQLAEAQTTIIRLRSDTEVFQKLRITLEGFTGQPR
jgi:chromosome segregation ATPase